MHAAANGNQEKKEIKATMVIVLLTYEIDCGTRLIPSSPPLRTSTSPRRRLPPSPPPWRLKYIPYVLGRARRACFLLIWLELLRAPTGIRVPFSVCHVERGQDER